MAETPFQAYQRNISDVIVAYFDDLRNARGDDEQTHWLVDDLFDLAMGFPEISEDAQFRAAWDKAIDDYKHDNPVLMDKIHKRLLAGALIGKGVISRPSIPTFEAIIP